jgi:metal-responsive CopG/Arc/MetJ family transcriptional regulator
MQEKITITLPQNIRTALDVILAEEGKSASDLISQAIAEYLFFRELRLLQDQLTAKAQRRGIFSEDDIFEQVS